MAEQAPHPAGRKMRHGRVVVEEVTEHHEFPSNRQGQGSNSQVNMDIGPGGARLPPGHPLNNPQFKQEYEVRNGLRLDPTPDPAPRQQSETNPDYYPIGLPSRFQFYDFKLVSARALKAVHQAKFARAAKTGKLRFLVEAVSSTMGDNVSAFDLTPQDFFFLLYWLRFQSFPKNPQVIEFTCTDAGHVKRTMLSKDDPQYLTEDTLKLREIMSKTDVQSIYLGEEIDLSEFSELDDKYVLGAETMRDLVEFSELEEEIQFSREEISERSDKQDATDEEIDAETVRRVVKTEDVDSMDEATWLSTRAVFLKRAPGRETIAERIEIVKQMDPDEIKQLDSYIAQVTDYGVLEYAELKCKECGARHRVSLSVDALSFLP